MSAVVSIETPLGALEVAVGFGARVLPSPPRVSDLSSGARVHVWPDVGGLVVDALVVDLTAVGDGADDASPTHARAVEWRLHATRRTSDVVVSALLPVGAGPAVLGGGEGLVLAELDAAGWAVAIGGPDEDRLGALARRGRQPASWTTLLAPTTDEAGGRGLVWRLPGLASSESARLHVAVAWCRTGEPADDDSPALAVDVSPSTIRAAAGLATATEHRRRARGT